MPEDSLDLAVGRASELFEAAAARPAPSLGPFLAVAALLSLFLVVVVRRRAQGISRSLALLVASQVRAVQRHCRAPRNRTTNKVDRRESNFLLAQASLDAVVVALFAVLTSTFVLLNGLPLILPLTE